MAKAIYKILIVEDEKMFQELLVDRLSKDGLFQIYTADNGQEGLDAAFNAKPDLILLDILMPVMSGIKMMKEMKKYEQLKDIPIIFLTGVDPDEDIMTEIAEAKPSFYLIKSKTNLEDIAQKIKETLGIK